MWVLSGALKITAFQLGFFRGPFKNICSENNAFGLFIVKITTAGSKMHAKARTEGPAL